MFIKTKYAIYKVLRDNGFGKITANVKGESVSFRGEKEKEIIGHSESIEDLLDAVAVADKQFYKPFDYKAVERKAVYYDEDGEKACHRVLGCVWTPHGLKPVAEYDGGWRLL